MPETTGGPASCFPAIEAKHGHPITHWQHLLREHRAQRPRLSAGATTGSTRDSPATRSPTGGSRACRPSHRLAMTTRVLSVALPVADQDGAPASCTGVLVCRLLRDVEVRPGARVAEAAPPALAARSTWKSRRRRTRIDEPGGDT